MRFNFFLACVSAATATVPLSAKTADLPQVTPYTYADIANLAATAPVVADVIVSQAVKLKPGTANVPPGHARFYVQGNVQTLIRGAQGLPGTVSWLVDMPLDSANRTPKLRKARLLLLARATGRPGELQLVGPDAQLWWTPEIDQRLRAILLALNAPDAPPRITGVGNAFYVPGSLPGESETQIFLKTDDGRPVSLNILRRPGEAVRWAVALSELVDDAAAPPARDTLLWYRLACALPAELPDSATSSLSADEAQAARADYRVVTDGLGACTRNHGAPGNPA